MLNYIMLDCRQNPPLPLDNPHQHMLWYQELGIAVTDLTALFFGGGLWKQLDHAAQKAIGCSKLNELWELER